MPQQLSPLARRLAQLERRSPQIREEATLRQNFVEALSRFLQDKGITQRGVEIVLDQRLVRGRPDARVGAIVFEVKLPEPAGPGIDDAVAQAQRYIQEFSNRYPAKQARGVAYDGLHMTLLDESGEAVASGRPSNLATRLQSWLISLAGEVIHPDEFVARLGPTSDLAREMILILWQSLQQYRTQVGFIGEVFKVWQGLYGVTTNLNDQAMAGLRRSATQMDITLRSKSHVEQYLFVVETYLAILLKLLVARVAVQQQLAPFASLTELLELRGPVITLRELEHHIPALAGVFEEDVFMWPVDAAAYDGNVERALTNSLRTMSRDLDDVDLTGVGHDFLRLVYQRFLDRAARRALGEFYTSAELVDETLDSVGYTGHIDKRVADITCGSGTFLVRAIERVFQANRGADPATLLSAITTNVIGVDIHPFAVAMARVNYILAIAELLPAVQPVHIPIYWADSLLRLGAARETMPGMRRLINVTLPGLDEKFVLPDPSDVEWGDLMARVKHAIARFQGPTLDADAVWDRFWQDAPQERYLPYENNIHSLVTQIVRRHNRGGDMRWLPLLENSLRVEELGASCDFIVGNPPWVRIHNISRHIRDRLFAQYGFCMSAGWRRGARLAGAGHGFARQIDYAMPFVERGIEFLRAGGRLGFVITSKVMHALYGNALRKTLVRETRILRLSDYSLYATPLFEDATNYPLVIAFQIGPPNSDHEIPVVVAGPGGERMNFRLPQADLPLIKHDTESPWVLVPPSVRRAFDCMQTAAPDANRSFNPRPLLGETQGHQAHMGVKTGLNNVFVVKRVDPTDHPNEVVVYTEGYYSPRTPNRDRSGYVARLEKSLLRPLIRGENIRAWRYSVHDHILWTHDDTTGRVLPDLPAKAKQYFEHHADALQRRSDHHSDHPIWEIFRVSREKLTHKVTWQELSSTLEATYAPREVDEPVDGTAALIPLQTLYLISCNNQSEATLIAAWFNSLPARAFLAAYAERARGAYFRHFSWVLGLLPLPEAIASVFRANDTSDPAITRMREISQLLHDSALHPRRVALQEELDGLVATLYGLSPDDLTALYDYFAFIRTRDPGPSPVAEPEDPEE